ncbi:unnamed protein product [Rotaria socialis]|uniref:Uncharacterized protein n=1 Tax=Rotaria socialis TaxID=392032 RepID=A0A821RPX5_9BILA|nr:unnamed protein product [Rotaria socialis]
MQTLSAQFSRLNQEKDSLEHNYQYVSGLKDQAYNEIQNASARQIDLEQEIIDANAEKQRLIDLADNEKQQLAAAEAQHIKNEKCTLTKLQGAYLAMPRSTKDIVVAILAEHNLTITNTDSVSLELAITSAELAAELRDKSIKDELAKRGIPLLPSGTTSISTNTTSNAQTIYTTAVTTAISSTQGIPTFSFSTNMNPPHSSPNQIFVSQSSTPPRSPPLFNRTISHSTPDPNALKTPEELEVERILNDSRQQLQSGHNLNLNLKPSTTQQTKYQRDIINRTNILVKFCDTSDDFDSFYTKISLYYGIKKSDNKFISEKDVLIQKFKGDTLSQFLYHIEKYHKYSLQYFQKDETRFQIELDKTLLGSCLENIMDGIPEEHSSYMLTIKTIIEFLASKNIKIIDKEDVFSICPVKENESVSDLRNRLKTSYGISHPNENHETANELINKFYNYINKDLCKTLKNKIKEQETWSNSKATYSQISNLAIILEAEINSPSNIKTKVYYQEPSQRQSSDRQQSQSPKNRNNTYYYKYPENVNHKKDNSYKKPYVKSDTNPTRERSRSTSQDRQYKHKSKSPQRKFKSKYSNTNDRSTSRDKSPQGAKANIPSFSSTEFYHCPTCNNISIGSNKCSNCLNLCHFCKMNNHFIKNCRQYKEDLIRKHTITTNSDKNDKSNIECISGEVINDNSENSNNNEPSTPKVKKIKKLNKNGNCKIFNKLIKRTPEIYLNPEELDNFKVPTLKSSIKC